MREVTGSVGREAGREGLADDGGRIRGRDLLLFELFDGLDSVFGEDFGGVGFEEPEACGACEGWGVVSEVFEGLLSSSSRLTSSNLELSFVMLKEGKVLSGAKPVIPFEG